MSDENKTKKQAEDNATQNDSGALSEKELTKAVGGIGYGTIKGDVTQDTHKDWVEIQ